MSLNSPPGTHSPQEYDKTSKVPKEVAKLSEQLQHLIMGKVVQAKIATKTRKIVIYVCAADSQGKYYESLKIYYKFNGF